MSVKKRPRRHRAPRREVELAADQLDERQQVDRIERDARRESAPAPVMSRCRSDRQQPRGAGGNDDVRRRHAARLREHPLLQLELLGDVLLDEIDLQPPSTSRSVVKDSLPSGGSGASVSRDSVARGIRDCAADPRFHLGPRVHGHHVDAEMQRTRGPAAADHARAQQAQHLHLSHGQEPRLRRRAPRRSGRQWRLYNIIIII